MIVARPAPVRVPLGPVHDGGAVAIPAPDGGGLIVQVRHASVGPSMVRRSFPSTNCDGHRPALTWQIMCHARGPAHPQMHRIRRTGTGQS